MILNFVKLQVNGNDFIVLRAAASVVSPEIVQRMCNRNFGIGADGVIDIAEDCQRISVRMWNPDGTEDFCGNGTACACQLILAGLGESFVELDALDREIRAHANEDYSVVTINLGHPSVDQAAVPTLLPWRKGCPPPKLSINGNLFEIYPISTGSTHCVIFRDNSIDDVTDFEFISRQIETHPCFPSRTSVLWVRDLGEGDLTVRIWERGVGETWSCGTGAAAVGAIAFMIGRADGSVIIKSRGGKSVVTISDDGEVQLTVEPKLVYRGQWEL